MEYPSELTARLKMPADRLTAQGVDIRPVPDATETGCFDPREAAAVRMASAPIAGLKPGEQPTPQMIRDAWGFPNLNLNRAEILTSFETLKSGDREVGIWSYRPRRPIGATGRPAVVYLHGGGWFGGSVFAVENPCRLLAELADCVVFSIDYALAPEHPYPAGPEDCWKALCHIWQHGEDYGIDRSRIAISGDSAGGNLAAVCALRDRDEGTGMLALQALIYPAVVHTGAVLPDYHWALDAYDICEAQRPMIEPRLALGRPAAAGGHKGFDAMDFYLTGGGNPEDPYVSPLLANSHRGLCPALIVTAEYDGLRIQGELYGKRLREAGVPTGVIRYRGVCHGFMERLGYVPQAEALLHEIAVRVKGLSSVG